LSTGVRQQKQHHYTTSDIISILIGIVAEIIIADNGIEEISEVSDKIDK
jgi:hypothetical protein